MTYIPLSKQIVDRPAVSSASSKSLMEEAISEVEMETLFTASKTNSSIGVKSQGSSAVSREKRKFKLDIEFDNLKKTNREDKTKTDGENKAKIENKPNYEYKLREPFYNSKMERLDMANLKIDDFLIGKLLGKGQFGKVYLVKEKRTGFLFALKVFDKSIVRADKRVPEMCREVCIHKELEHPNILTMYTYFHDEEYLYLLLEYAPRGDLFGRIYRDRGMSESTASKYIYQIACGLEYLHKNNLVHRDIKPENVIIRNDGSLMLADFGNATMITPREVRLTFCGTLDYLSPELIHKTPHSFSTDLWSLGVLSYELLVGRPPFETLTGNDEASRNKTYRSITSCDYKMPERLSYEGKDFIKKLLTIDPAKRMTLPQLFEHPWIQRYNQASTENMHVVEFKKRKVINNFASLNGESLSGNFPEFYMCIYGQKGAAYLYNDISSSKDYHLMFHVDYHFNHSGVLFEIEKTMEKLSW
ncbi:Pkinase-domain-containing protein [Neoconidiobolus thromboides FSU 785]|nr:Pkinase-domain-containing protein [Neoconidiobolus thromboides FSU 785]